MTTDPFSVLAGGDQPVQPRAAFARELRQRLLEEAAMPDSTTNPTPTDRSLTGGVSNLFYFTLPAPDLDRSKQFYSRVFGWEVGGGSLGGHIPNVTPVGGLQPGAGTSDRVVYFTVDDVERSARQVAELGGTVEGEIVHYDSGKMVQCRDDQGTMFCLQEPGPGDYTDYAREPKKAAAHGDLFYFALPVADGDRGRAFYASLLGWEFGETGSQGGTHAENMITDGGIGAGRDGDRAEFWFWVDDVDTAISEIQAAGGSTEGPYDTPQGLVANCVDDQGVSFGIIQPAEAYRVRS